MAAPLDSGITASGTSCWGCRKPSEPSDEFKKCGRCLEALYCSKGCQREHWSEHKKACVSKGNSNVERKVGQAALGTLQKAQNPAQQIAALCEMIRRQYKEHSEPQPWTQKLTDIIIEGFLEDSRQRKTVFGIAFTACNVSFNGATALSLGIGSGACVQALSQIPGIKTVIGFERVEGFKPFLTKTFGKNEKVKICIGDFNQVELPKDVDLIVAYESLVEVSPEELSNLLKKIHKLLVGGGHFLCSLTLVSPKILVAEKIIASHPDPCIFPNMDTVDAFFNLHGFKMKVAGLPDETETGLKAIFLFQKNEPSS